MNSYRLSRRAEQDLIDIYLYTARHFGRRQADAYAAGIEHAFELLADNPRMGRTADEIRPGVRRHPHAEHVIFYRESREGVLVLAVIHTRMRPDLVLDDDQ